MRGYRKREGGHRLMARGWALVKRKQRRRPQRHLDSSSYVKRKPRCWEKKAFPSANRHSKIFQKLPRHSKKTSKSFFLPCLPAVPEVRDKSEDELQTLKPVGDGTHL